MKHDPQDPREAWLMVLFYGGLVAGVVWVYLYKGQVLWP